MMVLGRATTDREAQNTATIQRSSGEEDFSSGVGGLDELIGELVAFFGARTLDAQAEQVQSVGGDNLKS